MYTVKYNNTVLHDPRIGRLLREPVFEMDVNAAGSASFLIDTDHPAIAELKRMNGIVELQESGSAIFRGRILRDTADFYNTRNISVEGVLACLNDSLIQPFSYPVDFPSASSATNTVAYFMSWLLEQHNAQVTAEQQIKLGTVTVTDPSNSIVRSSEKYLTTMTALRNYVLDTFDGYLVMRYETDGNYLDYFSELPQTNSQRVEFGENLLDFSRDMDGSEIYTAILPVGKDKLTIASEADGAITPDLIKSGKIIYSASARELYGNITRLVEWSDETSTSKLKTKAAQQLALGIGTKDTIEASALDLGLTSEQVQTFRVGRKTTVYSRPHDQNISLPLMKLEIDLLQPQNTKVTLGSTITSFTGSQISQAQKMEQQANELQAVENRVEKSGEEVVQYVNDTVQASQAVVIQALDDYTKTGDFNAYKTTVVSQFEQLNDAFNLKLQTVTTKVNSVENEAQRQLGQISKYFRFDSDGIWIGEAGNAVLLRLDNDTIQFLRNNYAELWLDPNGAHMSGLNAQRIQIGGFEIVSEADGKLSLGKAVN